MDAIEDLKQDVREGRVDPERLIDLIVTLQRKLQAAEERVRKAEERIRELEKKLGGPPTAKVDESFSMRAEERRQAERGRKTSQKKPTGRRGRITTAEKVAKAERT